MIDNCNCHSCRSLGYITEQPTHAKVLMYMKRIIFSALFIFGFYWTVIRAIQAAMEIR